MDKSNIRNDYFDVLKGIGIICVLWGHSAFWGTLPSRLIFSFHMPMFFVLSGIFFHENTYKDWRMLLYKVTKNLLLPYVVLYLINIFFRADVMFSRWHDNPWKQICVFLRGEGAMWFLLCLAVVQVLAGLLLRSNVRRRTLWLVVAINVGLAWLISNYCDHRWIARAPFSMCCVPTGLAFFVLGCALREPLLRVSNGKIRIWWVLWAVGVFCLLGWVTQSTHDLHNAVFAIKALPLSMFGLASIMMIAKQISGLSIMARVLSAIGRNSLCFFALETAIWSIVCRFVKGASLQMWEVDHSVWFDAFRVAVMAVLLGIIAVPVMWFVRKTQYVFAQRMELP